MKKKGDPEKYRLELQIELENAISAGERNRLGQFATPPGLAEVLLSESKQFLGTPKVRFLDPAFGTGAFFGALLKSFPAGSIGSAVAFENDSRFASAARRIWSGHGVQLKEEDFTAAALPPASRAANLIVCNPPYVRHHHLDLETKARLRDLVESRRNIRFNGLAGLYCYFLLLAHDWLVDDGVSAWLVPTEFMDVGYGEAVKRYLIEQVTLLRMHRFDSSDVQFSDALVSSAVVWFRKKQASPDDRVVFTTGNDLQKPTGSRSFAIRALLPSQKWSRYFDGNVTKKEPANRIVTVGDLFTIKRGVATGANNFFIITPEIAAFYEIPKSFLTPVIPGPRFLEEDRIQSDLDGLPVVGRRLFLLTCNLPEQEIRTAYPKLWSYLQLGVKKQIHKRYLCQHRSPWYLQEKRDPPLFFCSYMGRNGTKKPFRFFLNESKAVAVNVYLMLYAKENIGGLSSFRKPDEILAAMNNLPVEILVREGRTYGGGLHKLEPKELANVPLTGVHDLINRM